MRLLALCGPKSAKPCGAARICSALSLEAILPLLVFTQSTRNLPHSISTLRLTFNSVRNQRMSGTIQSYWGPGWGHEIKVMLTVKSWKLLREWLLPWKFTPPPKETVTTQISIVTSSSGNLMWNIPCLTEENNCKHDGASIIMSISYNRTTCAQPICSLVDHVSAKCVCPWCFANHSKGSKRAKTPGNNRQRVRGKKRNTDNEKLKLLGKLF